MKTVGGKL